MCEWWGGGSRRALHLFLDALNAITKVRPADPTASF